MRYTITAAKAIAAVLTVLVGSGIVTGHWLTDTQLIVSALNGVVVYLVPNRVARAKPVVS